MKGQKAKLRKLTQFSAWASCLTMLQEDASGAFKWPVNYQVFVKAKVKSPFEPT